MLWDYKSARQAFKNLKKFPAKEQERIFNALEEMKASPFLGDIVLSLEARTVFGEEGLEITGLNTDYL